MSIPASERPRLEKLKALAERGATEGERAAARAAMDRIMAKYGYRRKQPPSPDASPGTPASGIVELSFEDIAESCRACGVDLNELLASMAGTLSDLSAAIAAAAESVMGKSGKL